LPLIFFHGLALFAPGQRAQRAQRSENCRECSATFWKRRPSQRGGKPQPWRFHDAAMAAFKMTNYGVGCVRRLD